VSAAVVSARSPAWQRDELILALDLYFKQPPTSISKGHRSVVELSQLLNSLPIHSGGQEPASFRNPHGVYMKLCNFLRFDPSYRGSGLTHGNRLEKVVWDEFSGHRDTLAKLAQAIRAGARTEAAMGPADAGSDEESEFPEGKVLYRLHRARERNRRLATQAKKHALQQHERLFCAACGFDFERTYGPHGKGFIECHHTLPLSEMATGRATRLSEVALVCANCHRMLHRHRPWLKLGELRQLLPT
jgi:5-methylcytosine-specific restriction protein A